VSAVSVRLVGVEAMERALHTMVVRLIPRAARDTVNSLAFAGREAWQDEMRQSLTLRNRFTERRALVERATTLRISAMQATLGHTEPYMALLEEGKPEPAHKRFRPVPTEIAAGQAFGSLRGGRKARVRPSAVITRLGNLAVKGAKSRSRKANNARAVRGAIRSGHRLALLDLGRGKGIYRVMGGRRKPRIVKLYDLSRRSTPMPRIPTLERAVERAAAQGPAIALAAVARALRVSSEWSGVKLT
jgi:hypothetical protein